MSFDQPVTIGFLSTLLGHDKLSALLKTGMQHQCSFFYMHQCTETACLMPADLLFGQDTSVPVSHLQLQDKSGAQLSVAMGGIPSGRGQTLLLADWLRDQVSACTSPQSTGTGMHSSRQLNPSGTTLYANDQRSRSPDTNETADAGYVAADDSSVSHGLTMSRSAAAVRSAGGTAHDLRQEEQHKMRQEPDLSPPYCPKAAACSPRARSGQAQAGGPTRAPHLPGSASQQTLGSWQGLLPQQGESLGLELWAEEIIRGHPDQGKRALGVLGGGFGLLVHQVAMHCFERGALMAGIWNMYTALMDAELQSLEEQVKVLLHVTGPAPSQTALATYHLDSMNSRRNCCSESMVAFVASWRGQSCLMRSRKQFALID